MGERLGDEGVLSRVRGEAGSMRVEGWQSEGAGRVTGGW